LRLPNDILLNPVSVADDPIFQIDANLGYPAAVMNALVQSPDRPTLSDSLRVTLLPALPSAWANGSIKNARVRGGASLDLTWKASKPTGATVRVDKTASGATGRKIQLIYAGKAVAELIAGSGTTKTINF
jgi:alpha-L-fucosidase 2